MQKVIFILVLFFIIGFGFAETCVDLDEDGYNGTMTDSSGNELTYDETICGLQDCNDGVVAPENCPSNLNNEYVLHNTWTSPYDGENIYARSEEYNDSACTDLFSWEERRFVNNPKLKTDEEDCHWTIDYSDGSHIKYRLDIRPWTVFDPYYNISGPNPWRFSEDFYDTNVFKDMGLTPEGLYQTEEIGDCYFNGFYYEKIIHYSINVTETESQIPQPTSPSNCNADTVEYPICINPGATDYPGDGIDSNCDETNVLLECTYGDTTDETECCTLGCESNNANYLDYSTTNYESNYCTNNPDLCPEGHFTIQNVFGTSDDPTTVNCLCENVLLECTYGDTTDETECCTLGCESNNANYLDYSTTNYESNYCTNNPDLCPEGHFTIQNVFGTSDDPTTVNCLCNDDQNTWPCPEDNALHKYYSDGYICCEENLVYDLGGDKPNTCTSINENIDSSSQWRTVSRCCPDLYTCDEKNKTIYYNEEYETIQVPTCYTTGQGGYYFITFNDEEIFCDDTLENCLDNNDIEPCITNDDCLDGYYCKKGVCVIAENFVNLTAYYDTNIYVTVSSLVNTNNAELVLIDSENNLIDINIYNENNSIVNSNSIIITDTNNEYVINLTSPLEKGTYTVFTKIPQPCNPCKDSKTITIAEEEKVVSIPDNNLLVVLITMISFIVFTKIDLNKK